VSAGGRWARVLALTALLLAVTALLVAVTLSPATMSWLRADHPLLGQPMNWLEGVSPRIGLVHVLLFAGIALPLALLWRGASWWMLGLALLAFALGSELLQFAIPGRNPRVVDVRDDLLGAALGMALAFGLRALWRILDSRTGNSEEADPQSGSGEDERNS